MKLYCLDNTEGHHQDYIEIEDDVQNTLCLEIVNGYETACVRLGEDQLLRLYKVLYNKYGRW